MKTITNEIKAKYYNQYQFSHVCFEGISNSIWTIGVNVVFGYYVINGDFGKIYMDSISPLLLTPLEQIGDEDAINVFNIIGISTHLSDESKAIQCKELFTTNDFYTKQTNISASSYLKAFQYLQSKGYALPYMEYSVDDLIKLNVIKLK